MLFCSNPRGDNQEGWLDGRYGCFHDLETWRDYVTGAGFTEVMHYYRPPGRPRHEQPLACHCVAQALTKRGAAQGAITRPPQDK